MHSTADGDPSDRSGGASLPGHDPAPLRWRARRPRRGRGADRRCSRGPGRADRDAGGPGGAWKSRLAGEGSPDEPRSRRPRGLDPPRLIGADGVQAEPASGSASPTCPRVAELRETLGSSPALLVLDDAEHVIDGVRSAGELTLATIDGVRVLVTSTTPLARPDEAVIAVDPLEVPGRRRRRGGPDRQPFSPALLLDRRPRPVPTSR